MTGATRVPPEAFELPVERIRSGALTDKYFVRSRDVLVRDERNPHVVMQVFARSHAILSGVDEAIALLKLCSDAWDALIVRALHEGDRIEPWEPVLSIEGPYRGFAQLETLLLGALARATRVATQTRSAVQAAAPKPVLFFPARHDHWLVQRSDGLAAHVAGAAGVSTDEQGRLWGGVGLGTIPHALIAAYGGDTVAAARRYAANQPDDDRLVVLVDFDNDCVGTSVAVAEALGGRLHGVRLDTSGTLVDVSLQQTSGDAERGVSPELVRNVRAGLDQIGREEVEIVVSGGFDVAKIERFEALDLPVDAYGVGSTLVRNAGNFDFTADVVETDGKPSAKVGRERRPETRLQQVT